jgi:hypothetical protein
MSFDAELGEWNTVKPIGSIALTNCPCGSILSLGTDGMPNDQRLSLLTWVRKETERRGQSPQELLEHLRDIIRKQVLDEHGQDNALNNS